MASPSPVPSQVTDWSKCILCQLESKEALICPTDVGYRTIAETVLQFHKLNLMPIQIDITQLDQGNGIASTFKEQNAKWHKSCYLKFSKSKLDRAKERKRKCTEEATTSKRIFTRSTCSNSGDADTSTPVEDKGRMCFFCSKGETTEKLREVCIFQLDYRVRKCAHDLQDEQLLAKLSSGDLIALEAKYHARCLASLYNKARGIITHEPDASNDQTCKGIALAELISYIEEQRQDEGIKVFRLADLTALYSDRLEQLGVDVTTRVNSTHLKDRILMHLPAMNAYKEGRDVFMAYEDDVGTVLRQGYQNDRDEQSVMMTKIADMIRRNIFAQKVTFSGSFDQNSQVESVPQSLLSLVNMLINGSNIMDQTRNINISQPVLTLAQLIVFNCIKKRRDYGKMSRIYHSKDRETPLPVYMDLRSMH